MANQLETCLVLKWDIQDLTTWPTESKVRGRTVFLICPAKKKKKKKKELFADKLNKYETPFLKLKKRV